MCCAEHGCAEAMQRGNGDRGTANVLITVLVVAGRSPWLWCIKCCGPGATQAEWLKAGSGTGCSEYDTSKATLCTPEGEDAPVLRADALGCNGAAACICVGA